MDVSKTWGIVRKLLAAAMLLAAAAASAVRATDRAGMPPVLTEKTQGIFYVAAAKPYVMVVFGPPTGAVQPSPITLEGKTPQGKVFARWRDVPPRVYSDGTVNTSPPTYIIVDAPKRLPVILKVYLPEYTEALNTYLLWVNGRKAHFRQDPKPPYRYGTLRLRGGRTVIKLLMTL